MQLEPKTRKPCETWLFELGGCRQYLLDDSWLIILRAAQQEAAFAEAAEPGLLMTSEAARTGLDGFDRLGQIVALPQALDHFAVSDCLARSTAQCLVSSENSLHFVDQARREHRLDSLVNPLVEHIAGPTECKHAALLSGASFFELRLQVTDRASGQPVDFQSADDPAFVVRMQFRGRQGVHLLQSLVQGLQAHRTQFFLDLPAELPVCWGPAKNAPQQRLEVQGRTSNEQDFSPALADCVDGRRRGIDVRGQTVLLIRRENID